MANKSQKSRGLGRGLSALMADVEPTIAENEAGARRADQMIPIEKIHPNPDQPRRRFEKDDLDDLARSIAEKGVIQPIIVREFPSNSGAYQIVAGERRWRASQIAKLHSVPVIFRDYNDTEVLEIAIIENIQRADLNPVEEAAGYRQLMEKFGHTQERLAEALGKSRSHIANSMRLLGLPEGVRDLLEEGKLTSGHARALITADDPIALAKQIVAGGLSVREAERLAKGPKAAKKSPKSFEAKSEKDADTRALESDLAAALRMKVVVDHEPGQEAGKITISYKTLDELDELCRKLSL
ncbi:MAG: ParB/RepB/Spo0J family partition protein [Paracoccaceae bacterium]